MPRSHAGLVPKRITENVHSTGGGMFVRHRIVWVRPGKTERVKAKGAKLVGTQKVKDWEVYFQGMDKAALKVIKDQFKQKIIDVNKILVEGNLGKAEAKDLKKQKKRLRLKRELVKRVIKHKKGVKREAKKDYSDFTLEVTALSQTVRAKLDTLIKKDKVCAYLSHVKVTDRKIQGNGSTKPEKLTHEDGKFSCFKPQENEHLLRGDWGCEVGTYFLREICAYEVDKILGFGLVPPTSFKIDKGRIGSVQDWVPGKVGEAYNVNDIIKSEEGIKFGVFDSFLGNWDRHNSNWMYDPDKKKIWAIDNGLAFGNKDGTWSTFARSMQNGSISVPDKYINLLKNKKEDILKCVTEYLGEEEARRTKKRLEYFIEHKIMLH